MAKKSTKRKNAKKAVKKIHKAYIVVMAVSLVIGLAAGYFVGEYRYGKDALALNGNKISEYAVGEAVSYADEGIKYISDGKDLSDKVEIETNMAVVDGKYTGTVDDENELYIIYTVTEGRAKGETLYRVFRAKSDGGKAK